MKNLKAWFEDNGFKTLTEGLEAFKEETKIKVKEYPEEGLYVLNYDQIESQKTCPIVMECRGLIVTDDLKPVCRPFERFFNHGEALNVTGRFDFNHAEVYEKADGSLVKLYWWNGKWYVATRGTAFAESGNYTGAIFRDLIIDAFGVTDEEFQQVCDKVLSSDHTYVFEFVSPQNRVVTRYNNPEMILLGVIKTSNGDNLGDRNEAYSAMMRRNGLNVRAAARFSFDDFDQMMGILRELPNLQEGYVCWDRVNDIRVKLKSPKYVAVHRIRGESVPTPKRIMGLVVTNETDEYLSYFPEDAELFEPFMEAYNAMMLGITRHWLNVRGIEDQKEFAMEVKEHPCNHLFFTAKKTGSNPRHVFNTLDMNKQIRTMTTWLDANGGI